MQLVSVILLSFGAGFATPHVWNFITWQRGKYRRPDEWE
jgi:hypothetical protein